MVAGHNLIISLAARYKLPTIYPFDYMVREGGLMAYVPDIIDHSRNAAGYVDRILRGEKPSDLPVQQATNVVLHIHLKTAKALGLSVPNSLIGRADHVVE